MEKTSSVNFSDLPDNERLGLLIQSVSEHKEIWLLQTSEGFFAMFEDGEGKSYIPVWPEKEIAQQFASDDWEGYMAGRMGLGEFLDWMQELKDDQILIGAFPLLNKKALAIDPIDFKNRLIQETRQS